jgi:hypothetical protein
MNVLNGVYEISRLAFRANAEPALLCAPRLTGKQVPHGVGMPRAAAGAAHATRIERCGYPVEGGYSDRANLSQDGHRVRADAGGLVVGSFLLVKRSRNWIPSLGLTCEIRAVARPNR